MDLELIVADAIPRVVQEYEPMILSRHFRSLVGVTVTAALKLGKGKVT